MKNKNITHEIYEINESNYALRVQKNVAYNRNVMGNGVKLIDKRGNKYGLNEIIWGE